jgi:YggT family protein
MLVLFVFAFINAVAGALTLAIFARVVVSWVPTLRLPLDLGEFVWDVTEPILGPIRRMLPFMGGIDLSPFLAILLVQAAGAVLVAILERGL